MTEPRLRNFVISSALLAGCAHLPGLIPPEGTPEFPLVCVSRCGARLFAPPGVYAGTCEDFNDAEMRVRDAFRAVEPKACNKLYNATISVQRTDAWADDYGRRVGGITRCDRRSIQIGPAPWRWGAWAHEVAHLFQCPLEDLEHTTWLEYNEAGVAVPGPRWRAIDAANAESPPVVTMPPF